jgi:hypothetical protein
MFNFHGIWVAINSLRIERDLSNVAIIKFQACQNRTDLIKQAPL